nr:unnamed protein product [Callosobruchus chinensis]
MCIVLSKYGYKMPSLGSQVSIQKANGQRDKNILCEHSILEGDLSCTVFKNDFSDLVHRKNLSVVDVFLIDKYILCSMMNVSSDIPPDIKVKMITDIIAHTMQKSVSSQILCEHQKSICDVSIKPHIIKTVSDCHYVEYMSKKYSSFPKWSFGIHSKETSTTLLLGYLTLDSRYGFLTLHDSSHKMACIVFKESEKDIGSLIDTYVLLKDYHIVTEVFSEENVPCLEYICVKFEDIVILHSLARDFINNPPAGTFKFSTCFKLVVKSMVVFGETKGSEYWLQIEITQKNKEVQYEQAFLIVPQKYFSYAIHFREGDSYTLFHNFELKETKNPELQRIAKNSTYLLNEIGAHFQKIKVEKPQQQVPTVQECKNDLLSIEGMVTFEGVLKSKHFAKKLPSRTPKRTDIYGYGTPTCETHVLTFSYMDENDTKKYMDCFLTNWENIVIPLGLINQMRVIVKNVVSQSSKYFKSTAMTSFEVVGYEPEVDFQTINLNEDDLINWGPSYFLSLCNKIPKDVSIWGRVHQVQVMSFNLLSLCKTCSKSFDTVEMCPRCQSFDRCTDFSSLLRVNDIFGESKVFVKELSFLKLLFNLQKQEYSDFCKEIVNESYKFNISTESSSVGILLSP